MVKLFHAANYGEIFLTLDRLLVGSPRDGKTNMFGDKQGMIYKCRLGNGLPLDKVCTSLIGSNSVLSLHASHKLHIFMK